MLRQALVERRPLVVTTPNPEIVMLARRNPLLLAALERAALNIPDGIGLVLAARLSGDRLREHVQGTDLVLSLAASSVEAGWRWFFLGGSGDVSSRAAQALQRAYPGLQVAGFSPGSPHESDDHAVRAALAAAAPIDVLLVAYGAPKQELWLDRNLRTLDIPVGIGVGGVFNYLSGDAPRAPYWLRRVHLEWLHRLVSQPWRWRRQLALPQFAALAAAAAVQRRFAHRF
ncbi:MAG TPA: WecB/TagA/CpsF family glycosyltransferase [Chloroflexota bacterium]|nr:WecB/TagA/CpsF family glycosyltransferase [Chloroflexota bacterium]